MFKKLITNLPFNPSLLSQVSFYAKRLKQEESVRRLGFGFMALAMFIQMFAVIAPPQKSLAYSPDYIAPNGFSSKQQVLAAWDDPSSDIQAIYSRFGVTRDMIVKLSQPVSIYSTADNLWTTGRKSLSEVSKASQIKQKYKDSEYSVTIGTTPIYIRDLKAWDIVNPVNYYDAFEGVQANGAKFWILMDCGNFTQVGPPLQPVTPVPSYNPLPPALKTPAVELHKTIASADYSRALKPGDTFSFNFEYRNGVVDSTPAENVVLTDTLDLEHFDIISPAGLPISGNVLTYPIGSVPYSPAFKNALTITVKLKTAIANGTSVCNAATLTSSNGGTATSGGSDLCVNVVNPCPLDASVPSATDERCTKPVLVCTLTNTVLNRTTKEATLKTIVTSSNPTLTNIHAYVYDFGDGDGKKNTVDTYTDTVKHTYKDGNYKATVKVAYSIGSEKKDAGYIACAAQVETKPDQPLTPSKSAQNITQALNNEQTTNTKANPNDIIEYTLTTHNSYDYDRANYTVSDDITDILDYANLDKAFLTSQGGSYDDATRTVTWTGQTVKANGDLNLKFRVIVKDPVPATNLPGAMASSYDCVIGNAYGNEVSIPINCPPAKTAEYISSTLPNTGPGTSLLIGFSLSVVIAYFFARSRLLGKELELVRVEYSTGGGF